jgi:anti-anti-sigma regulatory factor
MLRITVINSADTTTLRVEGKLTKSGASEFANSCLPHLHAPQTIVLDFTAVSFIDDAGIKLVRDLIRRNIEIRGCSPLVCTLIKESQS